MHFSKWNNWSLEKWNSSPRITELIGEQNWNLLSRGLIPRPGLSSGQSTYCPSSLDPERPVFHVTSALGTLSLFCVLPWGQGPVSLVSDPLLALLAQTLRWAHCMKDGEWAQRLSPTFSLLGHLGATGANSSYEPGVCLIISELVFQTVD